MNFFLKDTFNVTLILKYNYKKKCNTNMNSANISLRPLETLFWSVKTTVNTNSEIFSNFP